MATTELTAKGMKNIKILLRMRMGPLPESHLVQHLDEKKKGCKLCKGRNVDLPLAMNTLLQQCRQNRPAPYHVNIYNKVGSEQAVKGQPICEDIQPLYRCTLKA